MHGGKVEAHSAGLGRGSEFVVRLPALAETPRAAPEAAKGGENGEVMARRVLLVDDNVDSADSLAELLRLWGHEVRAAHDASQALAVARTSRPDVAVLDIGMPDMNGYEVARLCGRGRPKGTAFVALTGYGQDGDRRRSAEAGFRAHLVKPVDPGACGNCWRN